MDKRITIVFFIYYLGSGGAGRTFLNILNNIDRNKFRPILVTCNYDGSYEPYLSDDIKFIKLDTKRLRKSIIPLAKIIKESKSDIVFSTIPNYNIIAILARLLSFTNARNIVREAALLGGTRSENLKLKIYGLFYKFSVRVIALSEGVKTNLVNKYNLSKNKIDVIYNPIDIKQIREMMLDKLPDDHNMLVETEEFKFISAGRLVDDKDHKTLLRAFAKVSGKANVRLLLLGEGPLENDLKILTQHLNIEEKVNFLGFQKNPYPFFRVSDVFVLSSEREGFGHVLAEALTAGLPIVSTNAEPGVSEVLDNGNYGILVNVGDENDLADGMNKALNLNDESLKSLSENGKLRSKEFEAVKIVKQYETVFLKTIQRNKG
ncbi:glycosyltransferase [Alkalibacillus almallahensis]|uniref:glycosyltransferase n=1 Tax=Alkalibacillus almallahensis TaxID=1379154 RepID=UPI0014220BA5|nr:glycosyltransferase [Alkalibacillus almallahensis]NIK11821.1 glycosyltransferase involved in cell wall biosynthesis [Alkalibacillus almallahensis]